MDSVLEQLGKLRDKDIYYHVKARIDRLCARSDIYKLLKLPNVVSVVIVDTTTTEYGRGDETITSTREKTRNIKKGQEVKVFPFATHKDGGTEKILVQIGGDRGVIRTGFYRTVIANNKARYWAPPIDLIRVLPEGNMILGNAPAERPVERPVFVLEPRSRGKTAEVVGYEAIIDRPVEYWVKRNASCPLTEEDIITLLHGTEDVPLGPSKRGHQTILEILKGKHEDYEKWWEEKGRSLVVEPSTAVAQDQPALENTD